MNIEISGRNYEVTDRIRDLLSSKLEKVTKYFHDIIEIRCVLQVEKHRNICEIMIIAGEPDIKTVQEADQMEDAIQRAVEALKRQAQRNHERLTDQRQGKRSNGVSPTEWQVNVLERGAFREADEQNSPRIIQTTNIAIRPMSIEQAALTLDDSRNEFIVFQDVDTEKVTVIYKRRDNNFGMIAPEF